MKMRFNDNMQELLRQITHLVEGWESAPARIERDLVLEKLRRLYEMVLSEDSALSSISLPLSTPAEAGEEKQEEITSDQEPEEELLPPIEIFDLDEVIPFETEGEPEMLHLSKGEEEPTQAPDVEATESMDNEELSEVDAMPALEQEASSSWEEELSEEVEEQPLQELKSEPAIEPESLPEVPALENSLFAPADIPVSRRSSRRLLRSLYGEPEKLQVKPEKVVEKSSERVEELVEQLSEEPAEEPQPILEEIPVEPKPYEAPLEESPNEIAEQPMVVGEAMQSDHLVVADTIPARPSVASTILSEGRPLSEMISLGESYMMIKELFYDDRNLYLQTLQTLDQMPSLDDCLIYIAENYTWNPNSEGVKRLQELLEQKFGEI